MIMTTQTSHPVLKQILGQKYEIVTSTPDMTLLGLETLLGMLG